MLLPVVCKDCRSGRYSYSWKTTKKTDDRTESGLQASEKQASCCSPFARASQSLQKSTKGDSVYLTLLFGESHTLLVHLLGYLTGNIQSPELGFCYRIRLRECLNILNPNLIFVLKNLFLHRSYFLSTQKLKFCFFRNIPL